MGKSILPVVVATVMLGFAPAVTDGGTRCPETNFVKQTTARDGVQRRPFGIFDTDGNWSYLVPREPDDVDITFRIFLGSDKAPVDYRPASGDDIPKAVLSKNLAIVCHGLPRRLAAPADTLVRALLQHQSGNVLEILWRVGGCRANNSADFYYCPEHATSEDSRWYQEAAGDARLVARVTARMLSGLVNDYDYDLTRVHFIGFGIGAHVGGFVAHEVGYTGNTLGRLTALDAASPLFEALGLSRLSLNSALRVDAVHTGDTRPCGLGIARPLGVLDVYVNSGKRQPDCKDDGMCFHLAALKYYTQSVEKCLADARGSPLPGYWTNAAGIVRVRWSSSTCLRLTTSDSALGASRSVSVMARWTLVVILYVLLMTW
ncbi:unnamed protein product [Ixodes hexagonus]